MGTEYSRFSSIFAPQKAKIGGTSAKQASKLADFAFGLHYLCSPNHLDQMKYLFFLLPLAYLAGNVYLFFRGKTAFATQSSGVKILLLIIFLCCALAFLGAFFLRQAHLPSTLAQLIEQVGTGWLVFTLYMVIALFLLDLLKICRLQLPYGFHFALFAVLCLLAYGNYHYMHPVVREVNRIIPKALLGEEQSLRIVTISDVHLGYATNKKMLRRYIQQINALRPDLVLIGGDLVDHAIEPLWQEGMQEELSQIYTPLGTYFVPGNHDFMSDIHEVERFIAETPIVMLRDSVVRLPNGLQLVGRDDRRNSHRKSLAALTTSLDQTLPILLVDHQPYDLTATAQAGVDLQFSGHTHRGQIWPMSLLVDRMFEWSYGSKVIGDCLIYVSSGLSLWGPPFRIGTDSEIVVFNLTFQPTK